MALETVDPFAIFDYLSWAAFAGGKHFRRWGQAGHIVMPVANHYGMAEVSDFVIHQSGGG